MKSRSNPAIPPLPEVNRTWRRCSRIWGELEQARNLLRKAYSASLERFGADHLANESYECHLNP